MKKQSRAGRPKVWNEKSYPLQKVMLPRSLVFAINKVRDKKIPVSKLISAIEHAA